MKFPSIPAILQQFLAPPKSDFSSALRSFSYWWLPSSAAFVGMRSYSITKAPMSRKWKVLISNYRSFSSSNTLLLKVGDVLKRSGAFSRQDVQEFSKVTHDYNPVHFDAGAAYLAGFDSGPIVHGMLVAGLFPQIIASHFPGAVYVSQSLQFKLPVYIGDEVVAEVRALNLRKIRNKHMAKFSTVCVKNGDIIAIDGQAIAMLPTLTFSRDEMKN